MEDALEIAEEILIELDQAKFIDGLHDLKTVVHVKAWMLGYLRECLKEGDFSDLMYASFVERLQITAEEQRQLSCIND